LRFDSFILNEDDDDDDDDTAVCLEKAPWVTK